MAAELISAIGLVSKKTTKERTMPIICIAYLQIPCRVLKTFLKTSVKVDSTFNGVGWNTGRNNFQRSVGSF